MSTGSLKGSVGLLLPASMVEQVAQRAADILSERLPVEPERWIGVAEAADHIDCKPDRIYALVSLAKGGACANPIPFEKDGSRLLFRRSALDGWLEDGGAKRAKVTLR